MEDGVFQTIQADPPVFQCRRARQSLSSQNAEDGFSPKEKLLCS